MILNLPKRPCMKQVLSMFIHKKDVDRKVILHFLFLTSSDLELAKTTLDQNHDTHSVHGQILCEVRTYTEKYRSDTNYALFLPAILNLSNYNWPRINIMTHLQVKNNLCMKLEFPMFLNKKDVDQVGIIHYPFLPKTLNLPKWTYVKIMTHSKVKNNIFIELRTSNVLHKKDINRIQIMHFSFRWSWTYQITLI